MMNATRVQLWPSLEQNNSYCLSLRAFILFWIQKQNFKNSTLNEYDTSAHGKH